MSNRGIPDDQFEAILAGPDPKREVSPDTNGYVLESNGTVIGYVKVDTSAQTLTFKWTSASVAWPTEFELKPPSGNQPTTTESHAFSHAAFPTTTTSVDVSTCQYKITQGGSVIGYLRQQTSGLYWYAAPGAPSGGYFAAAAMTFKANTNSGTVQMLKVFDGAQ